MIYEIRTYILKSGAVRDYEALFGAAYPTRAKYSPLYGFWHTEIGPLNQLVHIWPYESLQHRADTRAAVNKDPSGAWPPKGNDLILTQENDIVVPIAGMQHWEGPQEFGSVYELRMYTYPYGEIAKVAEQFASKYDGRNAVYPVGGVWTSELGNMNRLYQLFPYKDWAHRDTMRAKIRGENIWPPHTDMHPVSQLVRHMTPAAFSPLR